MTARHDGDPETMAKWLRSEREGRGWSRRELARRLRYAAHAKGDASVASLESLMHNIYRWERSGDISEYYWLLCRAVILAPAEPLPAAETRTRTIVISITVPAGATVNVSGASGGSV